MGAYALAQAGDPDALSALVRQHMLLVHSLAKRFSYSEDAFQMGCMGLVKAIRNYREKGPWQFSTYAVPVILGEMRHAFARQLNWRSQAALRRAQRIRESMLKETGSEPAIGEVALRAGIQPEELALLLEWSAGPIYDESGALLSSLPDPRGDAWLTRFMIRDILERMRPEESWLLRQRFLLEISQTALANRLHISQSAASRKEKAARMHFRAAWLCEEGKPC